jgi:hypothetical protein
MVSVQKSAVFCMYSCRPLPHICGYLGRRPTLFREPSPQNPELDADEIQLAAALREKDIAISQRDEARRERGDASPSQPIPPIPPSLKTDEIEARLDAWKAVETQLNDIDRLLAEGDDTLKIWENDKEPKLRDVSIKFENDAANQRNRLRALLSTYHDYSDLSVVNPGTLDKLATFAENMYNALIQLPSAITEEDYMTAQAIHGADQEGDGVD